MLYMAGSADASMACQAAQAWWSGRSGLRPRLGHHQLITEASRLVAGVTSPTADEPLASVWVAVVHQMAREVGGSVVGRVEPPCPGRNYYRLAVELPEGGRRWVLLNATIRLVSCQEQGQPGALALPFREVQCTDLFELAGFGVATTDELERPVRSSDLDDLTPSEVR